MSRGLIRLLAKRVDPTRLLTWLLILGGIYAVTRNLALVAGLITAAVVTETVDVLESLPGVDERWVKVGLGGVLLSASSVWLYGELGTPPAERLLWLPAVAIVGSLWVLLDARADFVQERRVAEPADVDDLDAGEAMVVMQHARLVAESLSEEPKTVPELAADCDLTESRVREAIDIAGDDGAIYPLDDADERRYAVDEDKLGLGGVGRQAAGGLSRVLHRLARPFADQF